jgi:hypothetical protein
MPDFSVSYGFKIFDKSKKRIFFLLPCCQWANKNAIGRMVGCREFILCVDRRERRVKCGRREQLLFPLLYSFDVFINPNLDLKNLIFKASASSQWDLFLNYEKEGYEIYY